MSVTDNRVGARLAWIVLILTAITLTIAVTTPPRGGPWCVTECFVYPYHDIGSRFPRDYWWMLSAMPLSLAHVALWSVLLGASTPAQRPYAVIATVMGAMSAVILLEAYWVQLAVVPASLRLGEHDGVSLLTQFNPHGTFIASEELGYLLMALSFACIVPALSGGDRLSRALRIAFGAALPAVLLALGVISARFGMAREYRFEVAAITVDWLALVAGSAMLVVWFQRRSDASTTPSSR